RSKHRTVGDLFSQPLLILVLERAQNMTRSNHTPHAALSRPHLSKLHPITHQESWDAAVLFH
ncbi:hypothetical protein, partial [Pseudomonas viridiflava]|uniref:hypothetical protein n=1 Tax=Pseudomonas viridiflava TaxID=33069 RepID=UPI001C3F1798